MSEGYRSGIRKCLIWFVAIALMISVCIFSIRNNPEEFHGYIDEIAGITEEETTAGEKITRIVKMEWIEYDEI